MVWSKIKTFVVVTDDKDSSTVIVKKPNYAAKLEVMIHSGIIIDTYINYWQYVKRLQEFLYRNFYNYECY